ncbi:MAG: hypothetical protein JWN30_1117 [Bacilli bacterium]|nr:hypothetical protein [Bacilli bacterium]
MIKLPVDHSVISSRALLSVINQNYDLGEGIDCRFLTSGLNDTYFMKTSAGKFIVRIYKVDWRTLADIRFEIDLLIHLRDNQIPVSAPIAKKDGDFVIEIDAPEGKRYAVLFTFAEGDLSHTEEHCVLYGTEAAKMHHAMDTFESPHSRFTINLDHLLDYPLKSIRGFLTHRPDDINFLDTLSYNLRQRLDQFAPSLEWGVCHGDLHGNNVFFTENGLLTHFDFDCGGFGWRAYDLAVFQWAKVRGKKKEEFTNPLWDAFRQAYQAERKLSPCDLKAIPMFVAVREIWLMGLHTGNSHIWGSSWLDDNYFNKNLQFLRNWSDVHSI